MDNTKLLTLYRIFNKTKKKWQFPQMIGFSEDEVLEQYKKITAKNNLAVGLHIYPWMHINERGALVHIEKQDIKLKLAHDFAIIAPEKNRKLIKVSKLAIKKFKAIEDDNR